MKFAQKLTVFLSLLCYLAAASVASVHAFPLMETSVKASINSPVISIGEGEDTLEDCHTPKVPFCDKAESSACKIFCSAMAQAMASDSKLALFESKPEVGTMSFLSAILSRQLAVEPHPPK